MNTEEYKKLFLKWIMGYHCLSLNGFFSKKESESIFSKISTRIQEEGYSFEEVGFYEYKFTKLEKFGSDNF